MRIPSASKISVWATALFILGGCTSDGDGGGGLVADLPAGWESAQRVPQLIQAECSGSPYGGPGDAGPPSETIEARGAESRIDLEYHNAHFRCAQDVEAFFRTEASTVDVLVQPVDMNPESVAACDCLYDITMVVEPVEAGEQTLTVYRRWDRMNDDVTPKLAGSETLTVE